MKVRFQADADLSQLIVKIVLRRQPHVDFQTARVGGLMGAVDPVVLAIAARERRALVTHDQATMPGHFYEFTARSSNPGVFIIPQRLDVREAVDEILLIWEASEAEEWTNRLEYLPL